MEALIIFVCGLLIGSFLNVVIYRLPRGLSIVRPGSFCINCRSKLRPVDLIPLISYFLLRGKCGYCGSKISLRYPAVELITGTTFLIIYLHFGFVLESAKLYFLGSLLIAVTFIDWEHRIIPNTIILCGFVFIFFFSCIEGVNTIFEMLFGTAVCGGVFVIVKLLYPKGMGGGDVKLSALLGAFLGWKWGLLSILLASIAGTMAFLPLLAMKIINRKTEVPFAPFLSMGAFISMLWGKKILDLYISLF